MRTQAEFAEEILEQCQYGTSVSNLMATLEEYRQQAIAEACKKQREICARETASWSKRPYSIEKRGIYEAILNAPSPKESV